ncbi:MAG: hypothetical protein V4671_04275 [Armatimonadota bacterium]
MQNFAFSTGKLYLGAVGATLDDTNLIVTVQSADFSNTFQTKEVREAASINLYPVADADYDAECKLSVAVSVLAEALIEYCTGAVKSQTGGANVYTASCLTKPKYASLKFVGKTHDGRDITIEMARVKAPTLPLGFKRDDFVQPAIEFKVLPVDAAAIPFKISIAQS